MTSAYREIGAIVENEEMKRVTGYAGRACLVTYSLLQGVTSAAIRQQTGHANVRSMIPYDRISAEAESVLQDVLSRKVQPYDVSTMKRAVHHSPPESPVKLNKRVAKKGKKEKDPIGGNQTPKGEKEKDLSGGEGKKEKNTEKFTEEEDLVQKTHHELVVIDEEDDMKKNVKVEQGGREEEDDCKVVDKEMESLRAKIAQQEKLNERLQATIDEVLASRTQQEAVVSSQHPPAYMHASGAPPATLQENPWNPGYLVPGGYSFASPVPEGVHGGNRIFPPHLYPSASVPYPPHSVHPLNQGQAFAGQHPGMPYTHPQYPPAHENNREGTSSANDKEGKRGYTFAVQCALS